MSTPPIATVLLGLSCLAAVARADDLKRGPTPRRIEIAVTEKGFAPNAIKVTRGEEVTLVFTRKTDHTCAKEVIVYLDDGKRIERKLPLNHPVEIRATFPKAGELGYACRMSMHGGVIRVP